MSKQSTAQVTFTDKYLQSLKPEPPDNPKRYFVREGRGFAVRVQPSGLKTFFFIYTIDGKRKHKNLGDYPEITVQAARLHYQELYNKHERQEAIDDDKDDHTQTNTLGMFPVQDTTFEHFCEDYLNWSARHHSIAWHKTIKMSLHNDVLPAWADREIEDIRKRDAIALLERVARRSSGQVANVHKAARGVFDYALQREYIEYNPLTRLTRVVPELKNIPRDRVLTEQEIRTVWHALQNTPTERALKLILVTAQRPGECAGLDATEVAGDTWIIPKERAEKGGRAHLVPLSQTALEIIGNDCIDDTKVFAVKRNTLSQHLSRNKNYYNLPRWTPHDLRRTARTHMARIGVLSDHAEAVLNHVKGGVEAVYNLYEYQHEKRAALNAWADELKRIVA